MQATLAAPGPDVSTPLLDRYKAEVRAREPLCQTVTTRQSALLLQLALVAANGQVRSAASLAADRKFWPDLDQATQDRLRGFIVRDLHDGDLMTALAAASSGELWGLSGEDWMMVCMATMYRDAEVPICARRFSGNPHLVLPEAGSAPWVAARAIVKKAGLGVGELEAEK